MIVGNETLLRKEVTGAQLAKLIDKVKSQVKQPVTYADVWEFWLKHPEIAPAVDFLTIHLLPYWEDDPSNIDAALQHVAEVRQVFGNKFAPKDVMIGETGWPSEGRQRETALPSRVNEARFIRGFVAMAEQQGWHYNLIEAFDQPWKRASEGAVGGYWGLFDADRQDKGVLAGPGVERAVLVAVAGGRWLDLPRHADPRRSRAQHARGAGAAAARRTGGLLDRRLGRPGTRHHPFCQRMVVGRVADGLEPVGAGPCRTDPERSHRLARTGVQLRWNVVLAGWLAAAGFAAAVMMLELVFDPRYRSFPSVAFIAAGAGLPVPPGERAASGDRLADLHHRCRHCAAAVSVKACRTSRPGAGRW